MADIEPAVSEEASAELLEANLLDTPIAQPNAAPPSDPADTPKEDGADAKETPADDGKATEAKGNEATGQEDQQPADDPNKGKPDPEIAKQAYQNRQRTRAQIAAQIDENYQPKTEEDLIEEGVDPNDARFQALREEMSFKEQRTQIAEMNAGLQVDAVNVLHDFPVYNPESPEYDAEFTTMVQQQYQTAARLQTDQNGIVLNAEVPLYDFHQQMAAIYSRGTSKGSSQGQAAAMAELAQVENPGGSSSTAGNSSDELADLEERLGDTVIT